MATKRKPSGRTDPRHVSLLTIAPKPWRGRKDALRFLEGDFAGWCRAVEDAECAGVDLPMGLAFDLATLAEEIAQTVRDDEPVTFSSDGCEHLAALAGAVAGLFERSGESDGVAFRTREGVSAELHADTLPLLAGALADAAKLTATEAEARWAGCMEERRAYFDRLDEKCGLLRLAREAGPEERMADHLVGLKPRAGRK